MTPGRHSKIIRSLLRQRGKERKEETKRLFLQQDADSARKRLESGRKLTNRQKSALLKDWERVEKFKSSRFSMISDGYLPSRP